MSKKLMVVLALNNAVLGGGLLYLYSLVLENDRVIGVIVSTLSKTISTVYENQFYVQKIVEFLSR